MKQSVDVIYGQPSSKQEPHLFSWLGPPSQRFNITTPWFLSRCRVLASLCSGSSRKVSLCTSFIWSLRHLLSKSDLNLRQRLFLVPEKISFRDSPPWAWYICLPLMSMSVLAERSVYFFWIFAFFDIVLPVSPTMGRGKNYDLRALPPWMFTICHYC